MFGYVDGEIAARIGFVGGRSGGGRGTSTVGLCAPRSWAVEGGMGRSGSVVDAGFPTWQVVEKLDVLVEREDASQSSEPVPVATDSEESSSAAESGGDCGIGIAPVQASRLCM